MAACVLDVVEDDRRRGFVYGTLPGHPEQGEESFSVEQAADGTVSFELVAFSRGGRWFTVLGAPVARARSHACTTRSNVSWAQYSAPDSSP